MERLGVRAVEREVFVLKVIAGGYKGKPKVPVYEIERQAYEVAICDKAQPPGIPFLYTLFSILGDLKAYGFITISEASLVWAHCEVTDAGRAYLEVLNETE